MISVIISSADSSLLDQVYRNIDETIGVPYEIVAIDNSNGEKGICEIYNQGIKQAKFNMLCFMHEDIEIKTAGWGLKVISFFKNEPGFGLIGVAGSAYKTRSPSGWNGRHTYSEYSNFIQYFKLSDKTPEHYLRNPNNAEFEEVACIDGVWFCTPKPIASNVGFDQELLKGFHCYDIDYSLSVSRRYKIAVVFDILLNHFSEGKYDKAWMNENIKLHKKWSDYLPLNVGKLNTQQIIYAEKSTFKYFIEQLKEFRFPMKAAFNMLYFHNNFKKMNYKLYFKLNYYILKIFLSK